MSLYNGSYKYRSYLYLPANTTIYLFVLILMATYFGPSDHHLTILQKLKVHEVEPFKAYWLRDAPTV